MYFDTHAHLDLEPLCDAEGEVVRRAHEAGVTRIVTIGIGPESSEKAIAIAHRHTGVYASVGLHPHDASACSEPLLARLEELSRCDKVVGIGETGLDFYRDRSPREAQRAAFREQIRLARRRNLPIIVHDRDAHDEILSILAEENAADVGGIIHCFSGDCEMARRAIGMNFLISIPGAITYKGSGSRPFPPCGSSASRRRRRSASPTRSATPCTSTSPTGAPTPALSAQSGTTTT